MARKYQPKGSDIKRNDPEYKKLLKEITDKFPVKMIDGAALSKAVSLFLNRPDELDNLIVEGKDVLSKHLDNINLTNEKIYAGSFDQLDGSKVLHSSDDEAKRLIAEYMKDEHDGWVNALNEKKVSTDTLTSQVDKNILNTVENIIDRYLSFMQNVNPKDDCKFIEKKADYLRLVEYTKQFFKTMIVPDNILPLKDVNMTIEEITHTFYKIYKAILPNKRHYPYNLFLFMDMVFSMLHEEEALTIDNYRARSIYKNFKREPKHYNTINPI